jgi:hypothetical protein
VSIGASKLKSTSKKSKIGWVRQKVAWAQLTFFILVSKKCKTVTSHSPKNATKSESGS